VWGQASSPIAGVRALMRVHAWSVMRRYKAMCGLMANQMIFKV
jgi:hypothetical protein